MGYPVIMGLVISLGGIIPLLLDNPEQLISQSGLMFLLGTTMTVVGIVLCSQAASIKDAAKKQPGVFSGGGLIVGLIFAVLAGAGGAIPPIAMTHATHLIEAAKSCGASESMAPNTVWPVLFSAGCVVNVLYCGALMLKRHNLRLLAAELPRNAALIAVSMAAMWIGSLYLYSSGRGKNRGAAGVSSSAGRCSSAWRSWWAMSGDCCGENGGGFGGRPLATCRRHRHHAGSRGDIRHQRRNEKPQGAAPAAAGSIQPMTAGPHNPSL